MAVHRRRVTRSLIRINMAWGCSDVCSRFLETHLIGDHDVSSDHVAAADVLAAWLATDMDASPVLTFGAIDEVAHDHALVAIHNFNPHTPAVDVVLHADELQDAVCANSSIACLEVAVLDLHTLEAPLGSTGRTHGPGMVTIDVKTYISTVREVETNSRCAQLSAPVPLLSLKCS